MFQRRADPVPPRAQARFGPADPEDRAEVFERGDDLVVVVADGAGGVRGGAVASAALVGMVQGVAQEPTLDAHPEYLARQRAPGEW